MSPPKSLIPDTRVDVGIEKIHPSLMSMNTAAKTMTIACTTWKSLALTVSTANNPVPGQAKTLSITTEPVIKTPAVIAK
jgi:hypothetical protein